MSNPTTNIFLVAASAAVCEMFQTALGRNDQFALRYANLIDRATPSLVGDVDLVLLDLDLVARSDADPLATVERWAAVAPLMTLATAATEPLARAALERGAQDYLRIDAFESHLLARVLRSTVECWHCRRDLHRVIAARRDDARRLHTIIARYADAILIVDDRGVICFANPAAATLFGRAEFELLGGDFGFPLFAGENTEIDIVRPDGDIRIAELRTAATEWERTSAYLLALRDITERRHNQDRLREMEQFNQAVLNSLPTQIAVVDAHGIVVAVNDAWNAFAEMNGATEITATGVGSNYFEICRRAVAMGDEAGARALEGMQAVLNGALVEFEMEYPCHAPAIKRWYLMRVVPLVGGPRPSVVISHSDITNQRHAARAEALAEVDAARLQQQDRELRSIAQISDSAATSATARLFGATPLREALPEVFRQLVQRYGAILDMGLEQRFYRVDHDVTDELRALTEQLGFLSAGPRDVIEIHLTTLKEKSDDAAPLRVQAYAEEGRVTVLELMGHLVAFYRTYYLGFRRALPSKFPPEPTTPPGPAGGGL